MTRWLFYLCVVAHMEKDGPTYLSIPVERDP